MNNNNNPFSNSTSTSISIYSNNLHKNIETNNELSKKRRIEGIRSPFGRSGRELKRIRMRGRRNKMNENSESSEEESKEEIIQMNGIGPHYTAIPTRRTRLERNNLMDGMKSENLNLKNLEKSKNESLFIRGNNKNGRIGEEEEEESSQGSGEIRCPCGNNIDRGLMIECETCLVWQHSICVGIRDDKLVPSHYFCELCLPRNYRCSCGLGTTHGKIIECGKCNTWQHIQCLGKGPRSFPKPYVCPHCDPIFYASPNPPIVHPNRAQISSPVLSSNSNLKSPNHSLSSPNIVSTSTSTIVSNPIASPSNQSATAKTIVKPPRTAAATAAKKKKAAAKNGEKALQNLKAMEAETKQEFEMTKPETIKTVENNCLKFCDELDTPTSNPQESLSNLTKSLSSQLNCNSESTILTLIQSNLQNLINSYSSTKKEESIESTQDVSSGWSRIESNINEDGSRNRGSQSTPSAPLNHSIKKMNRQEWGMVSLETSEKDQFLIEFLGRIHIKSQINILDIPITERGFLLLIPSNDEKNEGNSILNYLDARQCGNDSRFLRRSCRANAFAKEIGDENNYRVGIFCKEAIRSGDEVTISFDYDWKESKIPIRCSCNQSENECDLWNWFQKRRLKAEKLLNAVNSISPQNIPPTPTVNNNSLAKTPEISISSPIMTEVPKRKKSHELLLAQQDVPKRSRANESPSSESGATEKLGREERKLAMLMKRFEEVNQDVPQNRPRKKPLKEAIKEKERETTNPSSSTPKKKGGKKKMSIQIPSSPIFISDEQPNSSPSILPLTPKQSIKAEIKNSINAESSALSTPKEEVESSSDSHTMHAKYGKKAWLLEFNEEKANQ